MGQDLKGRVGLVGCVRQQGARRAAAQDLFVSPLFRARRTYVERTCGSWYVLSALHGLVAPGEELAPYDLKLKSLSQAERRAWSERVLTQLEAELGDLNGLTLEIHAGASYTNEGLVRGLRARGAAVELPAAGLGEAQELAFYHEANSAALGWAAAGSADAADEDATHEAFVGVARPGVDLERESVQCAELGLELLEDARAPGAPFSLREGLELEIVGRQLLAGRHQTVQRRQHIPAPTGALHVGAARAEQRRDEEVLRRRRAGRLPSHAADQADAILRALARRGHALIPRAAVSRVRIRPFASPWPMTTRFRARSPDPEADRRPLQTPTYHETAGRGLTPGPA